MWKKDKHEKYTYFWINEKKGLRAGLSASGKFTLWSDKGRCDVVQCDTMNEALSIMDSVAFAPSFEREPKNE